MHDTHNLFLDHLNLYEHLKRADIAYQHQDCVAYSWKDKELGLLFPVAYNNTLGT